ncbi:Protein tas [Morella rubra]|uniref:Protein tas n=1 Tax=Morella rubra TaxID=262757 RepID=A0A6A1W2C7_9ROSI|nr:Protein tas [Morella rubra]
MASTSFSAAPVFLCSRRGLSRSALTPSHFSTRTLSRRGSSLRTRICSKLGDKSALQHRKLGDSDLVISEITLGTMTFGEQNTEKEAHEILSYAFEHGMNALDTAEAYPIPMRKETQGRTDLFIGSWLKSQPRDKVILATKVCGYSERSSYLRDNAKVLRVDAANIRESVEKSLKRLGTDYIDLLQIHWPDRYVALFGEFSYDPSKWRPSVPFVEQLRAFQELVDEGKVRYIGVSNETSYGVMEFVHAAKVEGLPKIVSIQNSYSLLVRCHFEGLLIGGLVNAGARILPKLMMAEAQDVTMSAYEEARNLLDLASHFEIFPEIRASLVLCLKPLAIKKVFIYSFFRQCSVDLVEVCHPNNCNIGLLAYSPLAGGSLTGKYIDINSEAARKGRLNLFPGYMERYNKSIARIYQETSCHSQLNADLDTTPEFQEATIEYLESAKKHGLTPVQLALGFARDRPFMTSSIIGATSVDQLKEDIDAYLTTERPLPPAVMADIENTFKRYRDPAIA